MRSGLSASLATLASAVAAAATVYTAAAPPSRIEPLPEARWSEPVRAVFTRTRPGEAASNDIKILAHHPELFESALPFATYISTGSSLAARERELLILRAAWLSRSSFVWAQHAATAGRHGIRPGELERVGAGPEARGWDRFESTLLRAADEVVVNSFITDSTWQELAARYDRPQMLDALFTISGSIMWSVAMNSLGAESEGARPGWMPRGSGITTPRLAEAQIRLPQRRVPVLEWRDLTPAARAVLDPANSGQLSSTAATYGHNPTLYVPRQTLSDYLRTQSFFAKSAPIAHEALILRIALHNRSRIEWAAHQRFGREKGMTPAQVQGIVEGPGAAVWTPAESALLKAADDVQVEGTMRDETWHALTSHYDRRQVMDIVFTAAGYRLITTGQNVLGLPFTGEAPDIAPVWPGLSSGPSQ